MKFDWVDAGNDADWQKHFRNRIDGEFYAGSDPAVDIARRCIDSKSRGHAAGLYTAWNWWGGSDDGAAYAERTDVVLKAVEAELRKRGMPPSNSFPKVQLNNERHEPDVILDMLRRWRELRPNKDTSWTFEGGQAGWMSPVFVAEVIRHRVRLVPQLYRGRMANIDLRSSDPGAFLNELIASVVDSHAEARELIKAGFPDTIISPFYDAAFLPIGWDGFAFTMGRLP